MPRDASCYIAGQPCELELEMDLEPDRAFTKLWLPKEVAAAESLPWERAERILAAPAAGICAKMRIAEGLV